MFLLALMGLCSGCRLTRGIELKGTITSLQPNPQGGSGLVVVNGGFNNQGAPGQVHLRVGPRTKIFDERQGETKIAIFAVLEPGQTIHARITGGVQETYPAQALASEVTIVNP